MAMNTASLSAIKERLKPKGRYLQKVMIWPLKTEEKIIEENTKETKTKPNANMFLARRDNGPINGNRNAPTTGTKIMLSSFSASDIRFL